MSIAGASKLTDNGEANAKRTATPCGRRLLRGGSFDRAVREHLEVLMVPVAMVAFVGIWALVARVGDYPPFLLPRPAQVWSRFLDVEIDGSLWYHTSVTVLEIL